MELRELINLENKEKYFGFWQFLLDKIGISLQMKEKVGEFLFGLMDPNMKVIGKKIKWMEKED